MLARDCHGIVVRANFPLKNVWIGKPKFSLARRRIDKSRVVIAIESGAQHSEFKRLLGITRTLPCGNGTFEVGRKVVVGICALNYYIYQCSAPEFR